VELLLVELEPSVVDAEELAADLEPVDAELAEEPLPDPPFPPDVADEEPEEVAVADWDDAPVPAPADEEPAMEVEPADSVMEPELDVDALTSAELRNEELEELEEDAEVEPWVFLDCDTEDPVEAEVVVTEGVAPQVEPAKLFAVVTPPPTAPADVFTPAADVWVLAGLGADTGRRHPRTSNGDTSRAHTESATRDGSEQGADSIPSPTSKNLAGEKHRKSCHLAK
jgi:hypothetical protein